MSEMSSCLMPTLEDEQRCNRINLAEKQKAEKEKYERDHKSPFHRFYQINQTQNKHLTNLALKNPKALAILLFIFEKMDSYNAVVMSTTVIMEKFNISRNTACRAIKYLLDNGFIYKKNSGNLPVYVANNNLVWKSYGNNIAYCEFPANIVLTSTDQDDKEREEIELRCKKYPIVERKNNEEDEE